MPTMPTTPKSRSKTKMSQAPSLQTRRRAAPLNPGAPPPPPPPRSFEGEAKEARRATVADGFDLRENYRHAVGCLLQCEKIIGELRNKLASKDARIAALEEKIVSMSLELADSKALEDEHRLFKRRMSNRPSNASASGYAPRSRRTQKIEEKDQPQRQSAVDRAPDRAKSRPRPRLSQSWSGTANQREVAEDIPRVPSSSSLSKAFGPAARGSAPKAGKRSSMQLSSIGQMLLGRGRDEGGAPPPEPRPRRRRTLVSSTGSAISGVVFPNCSDDCLVGLADDSWRERGPELNEVWPAFQ